MPLSPAKLAILESVLKDQKESMSQKELFNVFPCFSFTNSIYILLCHSKALCNFSSRRSIFVHLSYFTHVFFFKFRMTRLFPFAKKYSLFLGTILHIISLCSYKKMFRIKAGGVVAVVENSQFTVNIKIIKKTFTYSMNRKLLSTNSLSPISILIYLSQPLPTWRSQNGMWFCNLSILKKYFYKFIFPLKRTFRRLFNNIQSTKSIYSLVMHSTKSFCVIFLLAPLHRTSPLLYIVSIHHKTMNRIAQVLKSARVCPFSCISPLFS